MKDDIFGDLLEPEQRIKNHIQNRIGVHHLYQRTPLDPLPGQPIQLFLSTGGPIPFSGVVCYYTTDGSDPSESVAVELMMDLFTTGWDDPSGYIVCTWFGSLPPQPAGTLVRYRFKARRPDTDQWTDADNGEDFSLWIDNDPPPGWAKEAIIYQVFPDRFFPGNGRQWNKARSLTDIFGGTLRGVIDKLDYIHSLGFNTIWLNPFFTTNSHHGYNASDYYTVEPRLGTLEDLKELIEKARKIGIRLILDFVANHWSKDHFTFQDALRNPNSPYRDWYFWKNWPHDYECYFNVRELPKVNLSNREARAYMLEVARFWLKEGFDGYRLDFAYGPSHDFWVDFRRACREINPDCWIFGEVIHTPELLRSYTGILDGTLDFFLTRALRETFALGKKSLSEFEAFLSCHEAFFPPEHIRPSFLDNHDETRFLSLAGEDKSKLRLAALIHYSLSGPPIVFAGTETGLSQERPMFQNGHNIFEECRLPMNWENADTALQDYYRKLNELRRNHPVIWNGKRTVLHLNTGTGTYAYVQSNAKEKILIAINTSHSPQSFSISNPGFHRPNDLLNHNHLEIANDKLIIRLSSQSGAFVCDTS